MFLWKPHQPGFQCGITQFWIGIPNDSPSTMTDALESSLLASPPHYLHAHSGGLATAHRTYHDTHEGVAFVKAFQGGRWFIIYIHGCSQWVS